MNETWKDIPQYEGVYQVSDFGRVKRIVGGSSRVETRGSSHGQSKLSEKMIPQIREMLDDGHTQKEIGKLFGVGRTTIQKIKNGQSWKHVK